MFGSCGSVAATGREGRKGTRKRRRRRTGPRGEVQGWSGRGLFQSGWGVNLAAAATAAASQPIEEHPCERAHYHWRPPAAAHVACFFFLSLSFFPSQMDFLLPFLTGSHWFHFISTDDRKPTSMKVYGCLTGIFSCCFFLFYLLKTAKNK